MAFFSFTLLAADQPNFTLHEWGTFTSVSGSDGVLLSGLDVEEEALPWFVNAHDGIVNHGKGYLRPLNNVTIKMETPVIYFYADKPFAAHVSVGFNGGSISQWFPNRSGGEIPDPIVVSRIDGKIVGGDIDFAKPFHGGIEWNVQVQPHSALDSAAVFKPGETLTWVYPRQTDSALVRTPDGAAEKFLFYRGVGNFSLPVKFTITEDNTLRVANVSKDTIPSVFIFNNFGYGDRLSFALLDPVKAGEIRSVKLVTLVTSTNWQREVYASMRGALVQAGLFPKEADAMLQTWWSSYFGHHGLRAFWIVPENFTRSVLPLTVEPPPKQQTRVLVGRSELLTPQFEKDLLVQFGKDKENPLIMERFYKAYQVRVNALQSGK